MSVNISETIKAKLNSLKKSQGLRASMLLSVGNSLGTAISAMAIILLSRFLGPDDFGIFSALSSVIMLVGRLADVGINQALKRHLAQKAGGSTKENTLHPIQSAFILKLLSAAIIMGIGLVAAPFIAERILKVEQIFLVRLSIIFATFLLFFDMFYYVFQGLHQFSQAVVMTVIQAVFKLAGVLSLLAGGMLNATNALIIYGVPPLFGALFGLLHQWKRIATPVKGFLQDSRVLARIAGWMSINMIAGAAYENLDIIFMKSFHTSFETGVYAAAARIALFANIIPMSILDVLATRVAKYHRKEELDAFFSKAKWLFLAAAAFIVASVPLAPLAIQVTVGPEYASAVPALQILLVTTAIILAGTPYVAVFYLFPKPQFFALLGIIALVIMVGSSVVLIPAFSATGAALSKLIARLVAVIFSVVYARSTYKQYIAGKLPS